MASDKIKVLIHLCFKAEKVYTNISIEDGVLFQDSNGKIYIKPNKGKKRYNYNPSLAFESVSYKGKKILEVFYDRISGMQISPNEIFLGEKYSRYDIKQAISNQVSAEREIKDAFGITQNKGITIMMAMLIIAALLILISIILFANSISNLHITAQLIQNVTTTAHSAGSSTTPP